MRKEYQINILLEKILNTLNNSRLEYLKAADKSPYPEYKRFLNKTSTNRNRFCQDIMALLRLYNFETENIMIKKINLERIITSPFNKLKKDPSELIINIDNKLVELYKEIIDKSNISEVLNEHFVQILDSINTNKNHLKDKTLVFHS